MHITIISGGSGSIELQKGFYEYLGFIPDNLINMYDDGKSTGIMRELCDVLGPSDLRKNHETKYKILHGDDKISKLFSYRFNSKKISKNNIVKNFLKIKVKNPPFFRLCLKGLEYYFEDSKVFQIEYKDFNLMNLVYGGLLKKMSPEEIDLSIRNCLKIDSKTIVNSDENIYLSAKTATGKILPTEGDIVDYNNSKDRIVSIHFRDNNGKKIYTSLKEQSRKQILNSDIIVISPGTVWSSIIPTFMTKGFNEALIESKANIYCVINAEDDGDTRGYDTKDYRELIEKYTKGIDICFVSHEKTGAKNELIQPEIKNKDKHFGGIIAEIIHGDFLKKKLKNKKIFVSDFDDTLYFKDNKEQSKKNLAKLRKIKNKIIVTGHSLDHVKKEFNPDCKIFFNHGMEYIDENGNYYFLKEGKIGDLELLLNKIYKKIKKEKITIVKNMYGEPIIIRMKSFKPDSYRISLCKTINEILPGEYAAYLRGRTTIEVNKKVINKMDLFKKFIKEENILYFGNDPEHDKCFFENYDYIQIKSPEEMYKTLAIIENQGK